MCQGSFTGYGFNYTTSRLSLNANQSGSIKHGGMMDPRFVQVYEDRLPDTPNLATSMAAYDPNNYSTLDPNINDGNPATFWWNNLNSGLIGVWIGLDSGPGNTTTLTSFTLFDYQPNASFFASDFVFESSNNGTTWNLELNITGHSWSPNGQNYAFPAPITARYFRIRRIASGTGSTLWVLGELEVFDASGQQSSNQLLTQNTDFLASIISETETEITNISSVPKDFNVIVGG